MIVNPLKTVPTKDVFERRQPTLYFVFHVPTDAAPQFSLETNPLASSRRIGHWAVFQSLCDFWKEIKAFDYNVADTGVVPFYLLTVFKIEL